jgi:CRP-like cAMP-binding protein
MLLCDLLVRKVLPMAPSAKLQYWVGNKLLAALPSEEYERISRGLDHFSFFLGESVYECGERLNYAYFPTTSIVSMVYKMKEGASAEMGMVGNEGLIGIALLLGGETRPNWDIVQQAGGAIRMKVKTLQKEFKHSGSFQRLLLRYTQALITQVSQLVVCNRLGSIEQRFVRWLLLTHDRVGSNELQVTQEFVSNLLGVRREAISLACGRLHDKGLINCKRGGITILNRAGLEAAACECYHVIKDEYDRLLGPRNLPFTV